LPVKKIDLQRYLSSATEVNRPILVLCLAFRFGLACLGRDCFSVSFYLTLPLPLLLSRSVLVVIPLLRLEEVLFVWLVFLWLEVILLEVLEVILLEVLEVNLLEVVPIFLLKDILQERIREHETTANSSRVVPIFLIKDILQGPLFKSASLLDTFSVA